MKKFSGLIILSSALITGVVTYKLVSKNKNKEVIILENNEDDFYDYETNQKDIENNEEKKYILLKTFKKTCN